MSEHRLLLRAGSNQLRSLSTDDFLWSPHGEPSSMETSIGPRLEELGPVPAHHVDLVRLAALVFLVDRSVLRERGKTGFRWERQLDLTVPVSDPDAWKDIADDLAHHLHVLTGDWWTLQFEKERPRRKGRVADVESAEVVCLFSGGADSLAGALAAHAQTGSAPVLVSHWDFSALSKVQTDLVDALGRLWGDEPEHHRIEMTRWKHQAGSGTAFPNEKSRRSRSMLFVALGLAVAAAREAELWMCENGFTSINPPLSAERRGSLTTRTTNPTFLDGLTETLEALGITVPLRRPFEHLTKGEVLGAAAKSTSAEQASKLMSMTHSCGKPSWFEGFSQGDHCGVCYGCLVRRGAFTAAGLADSTMYIEDALRGDARRDEFLFPGRRKTIEAVRYRLRRGYDERDILSMALPSRLGVSDTLDLVRRGLGELKPVVDSIP